MTGPVRPTGHTLVEMMVAIGLFGVVLAVLAVSRFGPTWAVFDPLAGESPELAPIEQQLRRMVVEVQEGTRIFYPVAGKGPQEGLGIVNSRGEAILYYADPRPVPGAPGTLIRRNLTVWQNGEPNPTTRFTGGITQLQINVPTTASGKEPSLVEIDVSVAVPLRSGQGVRQFNLVTAVSPRNLEHRVPDDIFPAGSPLVDP